MIPIKSERLTLNPIQIDDLISVHDLLINPKTDKFNLLGIPQNREETEIILLNWISENQKEKQVKYTFSIKRKTNQFIGIIGINLGKEKYKNAEVWFKIHPQFWNKGYATEALKTVIKHCVSELKLHRIEAGCAVGNTGSIRVIEKAGMILEGRKRQLLPLKSGWSDNFGYAILASDLV